MLGILLAQRQTWLADLLPNGGADRYVGLFSAMPDAAGVGGTEATGASYARVLHNAWHTSVTDVNTARRANTGTITFPVLTGDLTVRGWGIWDASVAGNLKAFGYLRTSDGKPVVLYLAADDEPLFGDSELQVGIS